MDKLVQASVVLIRYDIKIVAIIVTIIILNKKDSEARPHLKKKKKIIYVKIITI